jgi:hypothetical protein
MICCNHFFKKGTRGQNRTVSAAFNADDTWVVLSTKGTTVPPTVMLPSIAISASAPVARLH